MNTNYTRTHDIDWFYIISGKPIHVASAGGELPKGISSLRLLHEWQQKVELLPVSSEVVLNRDFIMQQVIQRDYEGFDVNLIPEENDLIEELDYFGLSMPEKLYYNTFILMAMRGFYSFDRTFHTENGSEVYHLVAKPKNDDAEVLKAITQIGIPVVETDGINFEKDLSLIVEKPLIQLINNCYKR